MKIILLSLLLATLSFSCRKENIEVPGHDPVPLVSKVNIGDEPFYEYIYDNENSVSEEKSKFFFITHIYNNLNQLLATDYYSDDSLFINDTKVPENSLIPKGLMDIADSDIGGILNYEYNISGQLINTKFSFPSGSNRESSEFSYDANNRISRQTLLWDNKRSGYINYLYDGKGNLINEKVYSLSSAGVAELSTTTLYEFDNYNNPYRSFFKLMIPGINTNPNNIIKETYTIHFKPGQGTDIVQVTITSYTYNSKGYPVRKDGTIEYQYQ